MRFLFSLLVSSLLVNAIVAQDIETSTPTDALTVQEGPIRTDVSIDHSLLTQDNREEEIIENRNEDDFDTSNAIKASKPVSAKKTTHVKKLEKKIESGKKVEKPIEKLKTILLKPIVLKPKEKAKKTTKMLNFDIDRSLAYRVSPKVESEDSRSVDIQFAPILNQRMRNILLEEQEKEEKEDKLNLNIGFVETAPLLSSYTSTPKSYHHIRTAPLQSSFQGLHGESGLQNQFEFLNEQPISPRSYQFTQDVEQPIRFQSTYMNPYMTEGVDTSLLSSFDSSLPSVPITEKNIVSLGIQQPKKLNQMIKTCIANNVNTPVCANVINSAKLLVGHRVANQVFEGIQI